MVPDQLAKEIFKLQKSAFGMLLDTVSSVQEQSGRAALAFFEQMSGWPREHVRTMAQWMDSVNETREAFNAMIRDPYGRRDNRTGRSVQDNGKAAPVPAPGRAEGAVPPPQAAADIGTVHPPATEDRTEKAAASPGPVAAAEPSASVQEASGNASAKASRTKGRAEESAPSPDAAGPSAESAPSPAAPGPGRKKKSARAPRAKSPAAKAGRSPQTKGHTGEAAPSPTPRKKARKKG